MFPMKKSEDRMKSYRIVFLAVLFALSMTAAYAVTGPDGQPYYAAWRNGPPVDPSFFPIAVWLQDPADAAKYKEIGVNVYVGLWQGPTEEQLETLKKAGMLTVCHFNDVGYKHVNDQLIIGWMHGDEPDNAQRPIVNGVWSPPILPSKIVEDYHSIKEQDSSRPVFLNLGQAVSWNNYIGRGVRRNCPEDYPEYAKGADIVSFDVYPAVTSYPDVNGKLWIVARGVERLKAWTNNMKPVWNCIETTRIRAEKRATTEEVRSEVWMSIVSGSSGLIYFVHEWNPETDSRRLLNDEEMRLAVADINAQIHRLAPVINSPTVLFGAEATCSNPEARVKTMVKRYKGEVWLFACSMRRVATDVSFLVSGVGENASVEAVDEGRTLSAENGSFGDSFEPYGVHIYRITDK